MPNKLVMPTMLIKITMARFFLIKSKPSIKSVMRGILISRLGPSLIFINKSAAITARKLIPFI